MQDRRLLTRFAWLSVATALLIILLKLGAYMITGSVGLLSDALESVVNIAAAVLALAALVIAARPPDEEHSFGHAKVEYFSGGAEGTLIVIAALIIIYTAVNRLIEPRALTELDTGLVVLAVAAGFNLLVARTLLSAARTYHSVTLEANARHLLTDVWTSAGVIVGVGAVWLTGWQFLDSLVAIVVALNIVVAGFRLIRQAIHGLMDVALPAEELQRVDAILQSHLGEGVGYHALRTRRAGAQRFLSVHLQVPGAWTVQAGHALVEEIEGDIRQALAPISIIIHLEPIEDPASWHDIPLNR